MGANTKALRRKMAVKGFEGEGKGHSKMIERRKYTSFCKLHRFFTILNQ
jgi:hypothetical protein